MNSVKRPRLVERRWGCSQPSGGGTGFNFTITPNHAKACWFDIYARSASHFQRGCCEEPRRRADREPSEPGRCGGEAGGAGQAETGRPTSLRDRHATVQRYLTMVRECALAGLATSR